MSMFTSFQYLVALHQHKHFGRAADACHITQPALSNAIRALEDEFGFAIVVRGRAFQRFTAEGERIFATAQHVLRAQELLKQDLKSTQGQPVGSLTLGAVPSVMPIAARFAGFLQKRHSKMSLTLRSMSSSDIEAGLENLSLDIALGYTDRIKSRASKITMCEQYNERYFLLQRAAKPSRNGLRIVSRPMAWDAAAQLPLCLLTPEMHNRAVVDAAFKQAGAKVNPVIETNSILTLALTVLVGEVSSILPSALVGILRGYSELEAVPLTGPNVLTPIGFMYANTDRLSHTLRVAIDMASDLEWQQHVLANTGSMLAGAPPVKQALAD